MLKTFMDSAAGAAQATGFPKTRVTRLQLLISAEVQVDSDLKVYVRNKLIHLCWIFFVLKEPVISKRSV